MSDNQLIIAVPKGRILKELLPMLDALNVRPEDNFFDDKTRKIRFRTNQNHIEMILVRSFDVPTFVAFGAAHFGVAGSDVLLEYDYPDIYAPLDLNIGHCHLALAAPKDAAELRTQRLSHIRVATKYPNITHRYFSERGIQAECIKLNGAMEIAPAIGLASHIVDLVSSGATMKANGLVEVERMVDISSKLIVNRTALKTRGEEMQRLLGYVHDAVKQMGKADA